METESDVVSYKHYRIPCMLKAPRKSMPPEKLLFPWTPEYGFDNKGYPFEYIYAPKSKGGRTVCTIKTPTGEVFTGVMNCSMSQPYLVDYGEDTAYNRARVAQGHECAYCRHITNGKDLIHPDILPNAQYVHLGESAIL